MQQLNSFSDNADQIVSFPLADGTTVTMEWIYRAGSQRWTINIQHPSLTLNGVNVCVGPNILRQWRNLIPFGIAVTSSTGLDPINATDLEDGTVSIFMLDAAEVDQVESEILAPIPVEAA